MLRDSFSDFVYLGNSLYVVYLDCCITYSKLDIFSLQSIRKKSQCE